MPTGVVDGKPLDGLTPSQGASLFRRATGFGFASAFLHHKATDIKDALAAEATLAEVRATVPQQTEQR